MLHTNIVNFIIFQIGWFCAVFMHNNTGAVICFALALINFNPFDAKYPQRVAIGVVVSLMGLANDYLLYYLNIISFANQSFIFMPLWLISLWLVFSSTLHLSLKWLSKMHLIPMALLSGLGGSLSYIAGAKLGAINYNLTSISAFTFHFINWFFLLPIILQIYTKLRKTADS